jgi:hypothetical protein
MLRMIEKCMKKWYELANKCLASRVKMYDSALIMEIGIQLEKTYDEGYIDGRKYVTDILEDEAVNCWVLTNNNSNDPKQLLHDIISWHCAFALDPCVSSDAEALIERGRQEARDEK